MMTPRFRANTEHAADHSNPRTWNVRCWEYSHSSRQQDEPDDYEPPRTKPSSLTTTDEFWLDHLNEPSVDGHSVSEAVSTGPVDTDPSSMTDFAGLPLPRRRPVAEVTIGGDDRERYRIVKSAPDLPPSRFGEIPIETRPS